MKFSRTILAGTAFAAAVFTGCTGGQGGTTVPATSTTQPTNPEVVSVEIITSAATATATATVTETVEPEMERRPRSVEPDPGDPPVEGAYAGAGGPKPPTALPISSIDPASAKALIVTPSGNITCALSDHDAGCGLSSYMKDAPYGSDAQGPRWWVRLDSTPPRLTSTSENPLSQSTGVKPQVVEYGQIVHYGQFVCASEKHGLTCWNVLTGHGAFMSREATRVF